MSYKNNPYSYDYEENEKLKQQLAERDELILELDEVREFYADNEIYVIGSKVIHTIEHDGDVHETELIEAMCDSGKLARTPLKNQALLDEIKGRV